MSSGFGVGSHLVAAREWVVTTQISRFIKAEALGSIYPSMDSEYPIGGA
jgi:hypothetical protein